MDFESHSFGVNVTETEISVELIKSLGELPKYQFVLSDKICSSYNANITYGIDILKLTTQEHIEFFGWKLISLSFPGNWYGQWGVCELEDLHGIRNKFTLTKQGCYYNQHLKMIRESIANTKEFAENNYSVDYNKLIKTKFLLNTAYKTTMWGVPSIETNYKEMVSVMPTGNKIPLKGFDKLIISTKQYIDDYKKVIASLSDKKDERCLLLTNKLKEHFSDILKKYYPFEIENL
ncbi:hypothetical protein [uncultured Bacteroides sp.]|uniref:hypothetical protein n=1 Tax=uncultured Bacteroides sp. TaxID=162156 RepID=UPI0026258EF4|nr:hypothetical protein [uncultured Bacteroides sp.]